MWKLSAMALRAATAAVSGMLVLMFHCPLLTAAAGQIDSISPTCASAGAQVTITGNGFGAKNVAIAVGDAPATAVTANGHSATFVVPAAAPLGATTVTATNPGGQTGSIAFKVCDLVVPDAWAGRWQVNLTYRDAATGSVTATYQITAFIRTGEPFGLSTAVQRGSCAGSASDTYLAVQCTGLGTIATCTVGSNVQIAADFTGDTITGSGINSTTFSGVCGPLVTRVQSVQISGLRLGLDQNPIGPPTTLVESFVPFASLIGGGQ